MKIHLSAAIDGNKRDYQQIMDVVESLGHEIVTRHVVERQMSDIEKETPQEAELAAKKIHQWIKTADIIVFETTKADTSLGFEVATALHLGKPVIVLYRAGSNSVPHGLKGLNSDKLQVDSYDSNTLPDLLKVAIEYAQETNDMRFNFFISPSLSNYLDWVSQVKKIPRSVYLRDLIEKDMEKNKDYQTVG